MNIAVVARCGALESIHPVENKADSDMLTKGVSNKGKALYCAQADTIRGLNGNLGVRPNENKFYTFLHIGVLVASGDTIGITANITVQKKNEENNAFDLEVNEGAITIVAGKANDE